MDDSKKQLFKQRIEEILYYVWDPIGVNDFGPASWGEYDSYAGVVWHMALEGKSQSEISTYLTSVVVDRMELPAKSRKDDAVAELVLDWKEHIEEN